MMALERNHYLQKKHFKQNTVKLLEKKKKTVLGPLALANSDTLIKQRFWVTENKHLYSRQCQWLT